MHQSWWAKSELKKRNPAVFKTSRSVRNSTYKQAFVSLSMVMCTFHILCVTALTSTDPCAQWKHLALVWIIKGSPYAISFSLIFFITWSLCCAAIETEHRHIEMPPVAGCCIGYKSSPFYFSRCDMALTRNDSASPWKLQGWGPVWMTETI